HRVGVLVHHLDEPLDGAGFGAGVAVEQEGEIAGHLLKALVDCRSKSEVSVIGDEDGLREVLRHHFCRTVNRGIVYDNDLVLEGKRRKAFRQQLAGIVADDDDAQARLLRVHPKLPCYNMNSMSHEVLLTQEGYEKIKKELEFLKGS